MHFCHLTILIIFGTRPSVCPLRTDIESDKIFKRSDHVAIIMTRKRGSLRDDIFELVEITGVRSAAVGCFRLPEVDFSETNQIAYLALKMPNFASKIIFQTL